jgi:hypothetical protein
VRLVLAAPQAAFRNCTHCQTYVYDETTGRPFEHPPHSGRFIPRPAGTLSPCRMAGIGCPKGTPENPRSLTHENQAAYRFDRECRAVGNFPDDPLVRRHAALIRAAEQSVAQFEHRLHGIKS